MVGAIIGDIAGSRFQWNNIGSNNHESNSGCLGVILAVLTVPAWIAWIITAA